MKFIIKNGLPVVAVDFFYHNSHVHMKNVLIDTGCAISIFDVDAVEAVNLKIDPINGIIKRMYGIGGQSELCYEQKLNEVKIGEFYFPFFVLQLGMTREPYGFDGILGSDFFRETKSVISFKNNTVKANQCSSAKN
jgi:hypothetical protein